MGFTIDELREAMPKEWVIDREDVAGVDTLKIRQTITAEIVVEPTGDFDAEQFYDFRKEARLGLAGKALSALGYGVDYEALTDALELTDSNRPIREAGFVPPSFA